MRHTAIAEQQLHDIMAASHLLQALPHVLPVARSAAQVVRPANTTHYPTHAAPCDAAAQLRRGCQPARVLTDWHQNPDQHLQHPYGIASYLTMGTALDQLLCHDSLGR